MRRPERTAREGWDLVTGIVGHGEILHFILKAKKSYREILSKRDKIR